jgi:hypothetical protein
MSMKERILIGRVFDVFLIARRGVVIVPVEPWAAPPRNGDTLELKKPDGTCLMTHIRGVEMANPSRLDGKAGLLIGDAGLSKDDVPKGAEVYLTKPA